MSLPRDVASLFRDALASGRAAAPGKAPGEVLVELARHFLCVWAPTIKRLARHPSLAVGPDLGPCTVPACGRAAAHLHHVWWQSHGGVGEAWNLVRCAPATTTAASMVARWRRSAGRPGSCAGLLAPGRWPGRGRRASATAGLPGSSPGRRWRARRRALRSRLRWLRRDVVDPPG